MCVNISKKLANTKVTQEDQRIFDNEHIFKNNYMGFFPPHINLFILEHIETDKPVDLFNRMKWMLFTLSMGKIKELTMEIEVNSKYWDESQLEVYKDNYK